MNALNLDQSHPNFGSGLILYQDQQEALELIMNDLVDQISARFALLADVTGQLISSRGEQSQATLIAVASLVASDLAASHEIARLTGQYADYQMVLREGQTMQTFIIEVGHHMVLLVQAARETPLEQTRLIIQKTAHKLNKIVTMSSEDQSKKLLDSYLNQEDLPDVFSSTLDDMWDE